MVAQKKEELAEKTEQARRKNNIILHGKKEPVTDHDSDLEFATKFIDTLHIGTINLKKVERIGKLSEGKTRPLKITLKTVEDKGKILTNLRHLKGKPEFDSIHVTEDFTFNERKLIREFSDLAKQKSSQEEDPNYIFRVRGNPKNGLFLKRMRKISSNAPKPPFKM